MRKFTRRAMLTGMSAAAGMSTDRWLLPSSSGKGPTYPQFERLDQPSGRVLNDASEMNPTKISEHVTINSGIDTDYIDRVRSCLSDAVDSRRPLAASTARHSMGGHSLPKEGLALTLSRIWIEPNKAARTYRVSAGTPWSVVISALDRIGFSPAVMQSNNDFGVGSTFCVNAHGWPVPFGPMGSTVRSFRLMRANGDVVICSRDDNADLFRLAMGGYGLIGIIIDLELDMVPNMMLRPTYKPVKGAELGSQFETALASDPGIQMAYGRLDVSLDRFFSSGMLVTYRPAPSQGNLPEVSSSGLLNFTTAGIFRAQLNSDLAKNFRWWSETTLGPRFFADATRNSLMNEPVSTLSDRNSGQTDILQEYFVPASRFEDFIVHCQQVIPASYQQLLNITVRYVKADIESVLCYAPEARIACVMLFSQEKTVRAEVDMARVTCELIECVLSIGGTYYLPYRPHASLDQFKRAYPRAVEFAAKKREHDAALTFRNRFWDNYLSRV